MAAIDKAAIAWTIAIVAFGAGLAAIGDDITGISATTSDTAPRSVQVPYEPEEPEMTPEPEMIAGDVSTDSKSEQESMMEKEAMEEEMRMQEEMRMKEEMEMKAKEEMERAEEMRMQEEMERAEAEMRMQEEMRMKEEMEMKEKEAMEMEAEEMEAAESGPKTVEVSMPEGTSLPGCEETSECYIPSTVTVNVGDTVVWSNDDQVAHTVTSGTLTGGVDGVFDSSLMMADATFEFTPEESGTYDYFCIVHPWMVGQVIVN